MGRLVCLNPGTVWFNLTLSHEYLTLRLGHTEGNYNLEGISQIDNLLAGLESYGLYGLANRLGVTNKHGQFDGAGVTWDKDNILLMAEYTQRSTDGLISDTDGWYVTGGYRFNRWLIHLTLSALHTREDYSSVEQILNSFDPSGNTTPGTDFVTLMTNDEKSVTLGANFHPKSNLVFKLELQHIKLGNKSSGMLQNFSGNVSNVNVVSFDAAAVF